MWSIWPDLHRLETGKVFSSSADAVMIPNSEELNFSGEITVSAWVKIDSTGGFKTILGHGYTSDKEVYLRLNGNSYQFGSWDRITPDHLVSANIPTEDIGEWVHLVGTYDGANWNLYRNGELLASNADTVGSLTVNANWHIGSSNGNSRFFDGEIREVAIWDSALNATQAAAVYAGTTPSADYPTVVTSYTYDAAGHLLTLTDPVGNTTSYTYNYMGLVATETNEKNATRYYSYDALGRLVSKTDRNGRITTYTYDTIGRLTSENWSNTSDYFMYTYDAVGNLLYATDGQHSYSYAYDALNRPIYTTFNFDSQSAVFAYTYDLAGRRTSSSLSLNGHSDRVNQTTYDFLGNATSIRQTGSAVDEIFAEFDYNANGLMTSVKRYEVDGNNLINEIAESLYEYNSNNGITAITHNASGSQIVKHSYTYDSTNNIVEYLNSIDGNTEYNYDFLGQIIGADYANGSIADETYTYDENGNRITANGSNYTTGDNNELTSDGTWTYTYDAEGNRISKTNAANTERELYTWDYRNRLTTVTKQTYDTLTNEWTTVQIVEYAYDYNNIWIRKTLDTNGDGIADSKTIFIPENYQTTVQIDNNTVTHHYLWTPNQQDKLLTDTTASGILWALTDHLETIRDVLDGNSSTHLIYDAFGNLISGTNPILFGYTGKAFDPDTALQNNINRWYDPAVGRWLSTDPIGFYGNDVNLYRYVENSPVLLFDPMGWVDFRELTKTLKAMCQCNIEAIKKQGMSPKIDMNRLPQLELPQIEEILADSDFRTKLDNLFEEYRKTGALVLGLPDIKVIQLHQIQGNGAVIQNHYGPIFLIINDISHIKKVEIQKNILHELQHFFDYNNPNLNIDLSNMTPKHLALLELRAYYFSGQCSSFEECVKGLVASVCLPFGKPYLSPEDFSPIFLQEMEDYFNRMKQWE